MTVLHSGTTKQYSGNWSKVFAAKTGAKGAAGKSSVGKKKSAAKKSAKKK